MVEHVLRRLTQIDNPLTQRWWLDPVGHVLSIDRAGGVVVAAYAADAACDEVGIARVFALHEETVAPEDVGAAKSLHHLSILKVNLGIDTQAANDARHRVPRHLYKL